MTTIKKYNTDTSQWETIVVGRKGDTGEGVPAGGSAGQVLAKASGTAYDTEWVENDLMWGGYAPSGTVSTDVEGYIWWQGVAAANINRGSMASYGTLEPFLVTQAMEIQGYRISIGGSGANRLFRMGIYNADKNWVPSTLLHDFGTVDVSTAGNKTITGLAVTVPRGRYFCYTEGNAAYTLAGYRGNHLQVDHTAYGWGLYRNTGNCAALPSTITHLGRHGLYTGVGAFALFRARVL